MKHEDTIIANILDKYIDKNTKTCIIIYVDASNKNSFEGKKAARQNVFHFVGLGEKNRRFVSFPSNKKVKINFKREGNMSVLSRKLAYEFVPTKDKRILEVDTLLNNK